MDEKQDVRWNLVGYARVSTDDQDLGLQLTALRNAGVPESQTFQEHISGVAAKRPQFEKALKHLRKGDVFVVWKLDRLGRSIEELIRIMNSFEARGIKLRSLTEGLDTTSALGKFFFHVMGALAQFERDLISERTKAGIEEAKRRGTWKSRSATINREQWEFMVGVLQENPLLGASTLATHPDMPRRKKKPTTPQRTTLNNYMDLLRAGGDYPFDD